MSMISGLVKVACLVFIAVAVVEAAGAGPKISCGTVESTLAPCFEFVLSGGQVPVHCCAGVKSLYNVASNTANRRVVCTCLKTVTSSASAAAIKNAEALPGKCGVTLPFKISPTIDCNKVY